MPIQERNGSGRESVVFIIAWKNDAAARQGQSNGGAAQQQVEGQSGTGKLHDECKACGHLERISKASVGVRQRRDDTLKKTNSCGSLMYGTLCIS